MKRRDLTPRELRSHLKVFSPTDAAFVLHIAQCERCRGLAATLLAAPPDDLALAELQAFTESLSPERAVFLGHLLQCERCRQAAAKILSPKG
jgi:bacterioferritin-associated ferredoxin